MQKPIVVVDSINLDLVVGADQIPQVGETIIGHSFSSFLRREGRQSGSRSSQTRPPRFDGRKCWERRLWIADAHGLQEAGVDTTRVNTVEGASGVALITTGLVGENNIVVVPGANGLLTPKLLETAETTLERAGFLLAYVRVRGPGAVVSCRAGCRRQPHHRGAQEQPRGR